MPKHILVVSQYYDPEPFRINDICKELVKRGNKVTVLTGIPNYPEGKFYAGYNWFRRRKERQDGVEIIRIPLIPRGKNAVGLILNYLSFVISGFFWQLFTSIKADCVFTFEVSPMTQALIGVWYGKRRNVPHVLYVQDLWPENVEIVTGIRSKLILNPIGKMVNYIYRNCHKILATSPSFVEKIRERVTDKPEKVMYWPQYAEEFYMPLEHKPVPEITADDRFKVIFTGNVGFAQGLSVLPQTAKYLKESGTDKVCFVIVGDGRYKQQLIGEIAACEVEDMFILVDRQPAQRIPELLAACDAAFVSFMDDPLFERTIPAKLQSYMACGMPIVAAASGETVRVIREAMCGVCCAMGDAEALAQEIISLKGRKDLKDMGNRARTYFEENYDKKMLMDTLETIIFGDW